MPNIGAYFQVATIPDRPYIESKIFKWVKICVEKGTYVTKRTFKV